MRKQLKMTVRVVAVALAATTVLAATTAQADAPSAVAPGHVSEPDGLYMGAMHGYTPNGVKGGQVVDDKKLADLIEREHPLLLDVAEKDRKPAGMAPGMIWSPTHRSLPGAVFLQGGGKGTDEKGYGEAFKARVEALTGGDKQKAIVTFCHPDCWGSYNAAKRLVGLGYGRVYWFREGLEGWQAEHATQTVKPDAAWVSALPKELTQ